MHSQFQSTITTSGDLERSQRWGICCLAFRQVGDVIACAFPDLPRLVIFGEEWKNVQRRESESCSLPNGIPHARLPPSLHVLGNVMILSKGGYSYLIHTHTRLAFINRRSGRGEAYSPPNLVVDSIQSGAWRELSPSLCFPAHNRSVTMISPERLVKISCRLAAKLWSTLPCQPLSVT